IEEEQAANARYWKILACCDDDDNDDSAITPILSTKEPIDSLSIGDEHLDTIPTTESDEVIKSSVEDLILIPSEFEGIPDTMCDVHLDNNHTPLEAKDQLEIGELMSVLNSGIRENLSTTLVNLPIEDDYSPLLAYVVWIFLAYLTYPVIPPYLHPFGNEDTIFDPGITINHFYSFKLGSSHRHGAFKKFNTHRSHLNEWPMRINGKNTLLLDVRLLLHLAGSQPMLKSSYKAKASVIISIPSLVGGVADVVVEIKGTDDLLLDFTDFGCRR
nr:hypothetical protein [Tanacetum cinerariifolium]